MQTLGSLDSHIKDTKEKLNICIPTQPMEMLKFADEFKDLVVHHKEKMNPEFTIFAFTEALLLPEKHRI